VLTRTKSACGPADVPIWESRIKREYTECATWRDGVLHELETTPPFLVVIAGARTVNVMASGAVIDGPEREQAWAAGARPYDSPADRAGRAGRDHRRHAPSRERCAGVPVRARRRRTRLRHTAVASGGRALARSRTRRRHQRRRHLRGPDGLDLPDRSLSASDLVAPGVSRLPAHFDAAGRVAHRAARVPPTWLATSLTHHVDGAAAGATIITALSEKKIRQRRGSVRLNTP